jgi:hypothetical protein
LKAAFRATVVASGGLKVAATLTRGTIATLQRQYDPLRGDLFPAVDTVLDLEITTGMPRVVRLMAETMGYRLVPMESALGRGANATERTLPERHTLVAMREFGEFAGAVVDMDADGIRTVKELRRAIKEGTEAREAIEASLDALYRDLAVAMARTGSERGGAE